MSKTDQPIYMDDFITEKTFLSLANSIPEEDLHPTEQEREILLGLERWEKRSERLLGDYVLGEPFSCHGV